MRPRAAYTLRVLPALASSTRKHGLAAVAVAVVAVVAVMALAGFSGGTFDEMSRETGRLTFALDPRLGPEATAGAIDAFSAWDAANPDLALAEAEAWSTADVRVAAMDVVCTGEQIINGCACRGLSLLCPELDNIEIGRACRVPGGATIGVAQGVYASSGEFLAYSRADMRDLVAHEFGHNLGLVHTTVSSHLMYGRVGDYPYSDRGYDVPAPISAWGHAPHLPVAELDAARTCAAP